MSNLLGTVFSFRLLVLHFAGHVFRPHKIRSGGTGSDVEVPYLSVTPGIRLECQLYFLAVLPPKPVPRNFLSATGCDIESVGKVNADYIGYKERSWKFTGQT